MPRANGTVAIDIHRCKGCELCVTACPTKTLILSPNINLRGYNYATLHEDNCTGCKACAMVCPDAVITVYRRKRVAVHG